MEKLIESAIAFDTIEEQLERWEIEPQEALSKLTNLSNSIMEEASETVKMLLLLREKYEKENNY